MTTESNNLARGRELMHSFRQVHRSMTALMRLQADSLGLTPAQLLVLRTLFEEPGLSLTDLADRVELGCSTTSGVVKRLVDAGVVQRDRLDEDQRTVAIRLTDKGLALLNQAYGDDSLLFRALHRLLRVPDKDVDTLLAMHQVLNRELTHILNTESRTER